MSSSPTAFVVDDDPGVRKSLTWLLESVQVRVETFASGKDFLEALDPERAGCVVLDLRMPGWSGLDVYEKLTARGVTLPVIILTGFGDVPVAVRALKSGVFDFLEKTVSQHQLLERIQAAMAKDVQDRRERVERDSIRRRLESLTSRQREILSLVASGETSKDIAARLVLSLSTVEGHRASILKKLQASGVADLVRMVAAVDADRRGAAPGSPPAPKVAG